ncbi:NADH-quinone oxidoreductase subunit C, partial [Streptomyces sp. AA8]|nr:NADH-quinone oxidoreductase subunit C [Streptomyces telluris]
APWHHARPAFDEPQKPEPAEPPAATESPEAELGTPSRRDGAQPERRDPAVPSSPADEATPGAAEEPPGTPEREAEP